MASSSSSDPPTAGELREYIILRRIRDAQTQIVREFLNSTLRRELNFPLLVPHGNPPPPPSHLEALAALREHLANDVIFRPNDFDTEIQTAVNEYVRKALRFYQRGDPRDPLLRANKSMTSEEMHLFMSDFSVCEQAIDRLLSSQESYNSESNSLYERRLPALISEEILPALWNTKHCSPDGAETAAKNFWREPKELATDSQCGICKKEVRGEYAALDAEHRPVQSLCGHLFGKSCLEKYVEEETEKYKEWSERWHAENMISVHREVLEKECRGEWDAVQAIKPPEMNDRPKFFACPVCGKTLRWEPKEHPRLFVTRPYRWELHCGPDMAKLLAKNDDIEVLKGWRAFVATLPPRPNRIRIEDFNVEDIYRDLFRPTKDLRQRLGNLSWFLQDVDKDEEDPNSDETVDLLVLMSYLTLDRLGAHVRKDPEALRRISNAQVRVLARLHLLQFRLLLRQLLLTEKHYGVI